MTTQLSDKTGAPVSVGLDETGPVGAYTVHLADGTLAGSAEFVDAPGADGERIFIHTEVEREFSGRGLGMLLVRAALADSIRKDLTVVPVCPMFASHLKELGARFMVDGGRFRQPTRADFALLTNAMRSDA